MPHAMPNPAASPHQGPQRALDRRGAAGPQVRAYLRDGLATLLDLEHALTSSGAGDPEALHRHRVELRRIRVIAGQFKSVFHPVPGGLLRSLLAGWGKCSNRARDLEVMLEARRHHATLVPTDLFTALDGFYAALASERDREIQAVLQRFAGTAHRTEHAKAADILAFADPGGDHDTPLEQLARHRAWRTYRRIRSQAEDDSGLHDPAVVHGLRIRCKKLRYLLDVFGHVAAPEAHEGLRNQLRSTQTALGSFNDTRVQLSELRRIAPVFRRSRTVRLAIEALRGVITDESSGRFTAVAEAVADLTSETTRMRYSRFLHRS